MRTAFPSDLELFTRPVVLVVAHPDDEVIALGVRLRFFENLQAIIHVTDGAPRTGSDARNAGAATWLEYARIRRDEFEKAIRQAGARPRHKFCLWCPDQQAYRRIARHAFQLADLLARFRTRYVFTHPYEGGHPDHDAVAAAVHSAVWLLQKRGRRAPRILEFASYHNSPSGMETECFLPSPDTAVQERTLTEAERAAKQRVFDCYASQRPVLMNFPARSEPLRTAPQYDFTQPPHSGKLLYEGFGWNITGAEWRRRARRALQQIQQSR
jgi:N-acetylglucosamine malate deacetylase 2